MHLSTSSFSEHQALGAYYDEIVDLTDRFAEAYMGKYEQIKEFPSEFHSAKNPGKYFEGLKDFVKECREDLPQDTELQNIVDEIADLVNSTLYKLRFLK
jgi:NifB/MoaA-like Fe-S oxidoreductase